jgi:ABC-type glycerol-3-phosphate transport system permease component
MAVATFLHTLLFAAPLAFALVRALRRDRARELLFALHVFSLLAVAMVAFGDARFRAPYDGIVITLAVGVYAAWVERLARRLRG